MINISFINAIWLEIQDSGFGIYDSRFEKKSMEMSIHIKGKCVFTKSKYVSTIVLL